MIDAIACARCDGALLLERKRWRCTWCGNAGVYVEHWRRGRRMRVLFTQPAEVTHDAG